MNKKRIILIPAAGEGRRFADVGYELPKPLIEITDRFSGKKIPMIVGAIGDIMSIMGSECWPIVVAQEGHQAKYDVARRIAEHIPRAEFIFTTADRITKGQAVDCLRAKNLLADDCELFIGACDNGMVLQQQIFENMVQDQTIDAIILTHRNNEAVLAKPEAYGWVVVQGDQQPIAKTISVKKPISDNPLNDHAIVGSFWFRHARDFILATEKMVALDDKINGEFYVDQAMQYLVSMGKKVAVLEVSKYICWGTPKDYQEYEQTINYWLEFVRTERLNSL